MVNSHFVVLRVVLVLSLCVTGLDVAVVNAQSLACPADWTRDPMSVTEETLAFNDREYRDIPDLSHSYSFDASEVGSGDYSPTTNRSVSAQFNTIAYTGVFTRIFGNFMNSLYPFITGGQYEVSELLNAQDRDRWEGIHCLDGLSNASSSQQGTFSHKIDATLTVLERYTDGYLCNITDASGKKIGERFVDDPSKCTEDGESENDYEDVEKSRPVSADVEKTSTDSFPMSYRLALRDIARKTAYSIKEQYCSSSDAQACLNDNYTCIQEGELAPNGDVVEIPDYDVAAIGKDGKCYLNTDIATKGVAADVAQRMCTRIRDDQQVGRLNSLICHYGQLAYDPHPNTAHMTVQMSVSDAPENSNILPFDTDLFVDNFETDCVGVVNDCIPNGYYRRALRDKLSVFNDFDRMLFDTMKYRFSMGSEAIVPYEVTTSPDQGYRAGSRRLPDAWTFDYVEKLGGYVMMSEEVRFMNPGLLPSGDRVLSEGGNEVYSRGGQVFFNNYAVSNRQHVDLQGVPANMNSAGSANFATLRAAIDELQRVYDNGGDVDAVIAAYQYHLTSLQDGRAVNAFRLFYEYVQQQVVVDGQCGGLDRAQCEQDDPGLFGELRSRFRAYSAAYKEYRDQNEVALSASNPTLSCNRFGYCLVTYVSGRQLFAGVSAHGGDIAQMILIPGVDTFTQITHRSFLTDQNTIIVVYSDLSSRTYRVIHVNLRDGRTTVLDTGVNFLWQMGSTYDSFRDQLHIAYLGETAIKEFVHRVFSVNSMTDLQITPLHPKPLVVGDNNTEFFAYFRPGPSLAMNVDLNGSLHVVTPVVDKLVGGGYEGFAHALGYYKIFPAEFGTERLIREPSVITDILSDKQAWRLAPGASVIASRILSNSGDSIKTDVLGNPYVVYINRAWNFRVADEPDPEWEIYYQAFVAHNIGNGWQIRPMSDRVLMPYGELRNVFISNDAMGVTLSDYVTKRDVYTKMWDGAGSKRCVYSDSMVATISLGTTHCGRVAGVEYVQSNQGNPTYLPAVYPN